MSTNKLEPLLTDCSPIEAGTEPSFGGSSEASGGERPEATAGAADGPQDDDREPAGRVCRYCGRAHGTRFHPGCPGPRLKDAANSKIVSRQLRRRRRADYLAHLGARGLTEATASPLQKAVCKALATCSVQVAFWTHRLDLIAGGASPGNRRRDVEKALAEWVGRQSEAIRDYERALPPARAVSVEALDASVLSWIPGERLQLMRSWLSEARERMQAGEPEAIDAPTVDLLEHYKRTEPAQIVELLEDRSTLEVALAKPALAEPVDAIEAPAVEETREDSYAADFKASEQQRERNQMIAFKQQTGGLPANWNW